MFNLPTFARLVPLPIPSDRLQTDAFGVFVHVECCSQRISSSSRSFRSFSTAPPSSASPRSFLNRAFPLLAARLALLRALDAQAAEAYLAAHAGDKSAVVVR